MNNDHARLSERKFTAGRRSRGQTKGLVTANDEHQSRHGTANNMQVAASEPLERFPISLHRILSL